AARLLNGHAVPPLPPPLPQGPGDGRSARVEVRFLGEDDEVSWVIGDGSQDILRKTPLQARVGGENHLAFRLGIVRALLQNSLDLGLPFEQSEVLEVKGTGLFPLGPAAGAAGAVP